MELELSLALSSYDHFEPTSRLKEMKLITHVDCMVDGVCDDEDSTLSSRSCVDNHGKDDDDDDEESDSIWYVDHGMKKKRRFEDGFDFGNKTLPLLVWSEKPNDHYKEPKRLCNSTSFVFHKSEEGIVGWPPIKSYRKKQCQQCHQMLRRGRCSQAGENGGACGGFRSLYVKVQMEGFLITRKIDLKLHHSYESLTPSLLTLFGKGMDGVESYKLTYQDKDGDWLLVGDLPWRTFVRSVQRLKLTRRDG